MLNCLSGGMIAAQGGLAPGQDQVQQLLGLLDVARLEQGLGVEACRLERVGVIEATTAPMASSRLSAQQSPSSADERLSSAYSAGRARPAMVGHGGQTSARADVAQVSNDRRRLSPVAWRHFSKGVSAGTSSAMFVDGCSVLVDSGYLIGPEILMNRMKSADEARSPWPERFKTELAGQPCLARLSVSADAGIAPTAARLSRKCSV